MLKIKLSRAGRKNKPIFRIILQEDYKDPKSNYIEKLGFVDRINKKFEIKKQRVLYWLEKGAQPTDVVKNLLIKSGIIKGEKIDVSKSARKRKKKKSTKENEAKS